MVLTQKDLDNLLVYLEKSIRNLADNAVQSLEFHENIEEVEKFVSSQFDIRLENILQSKNSSIHHLESGMKNKVIQRKKEILEEIKNKINS